VPIRIMGATACVCVYVRRCTSDPSILSDGVIDDVIVCCCSVVEAADVSIGVTVTGESVCV